MNFYIPSSYSRIVYQFQCNLSFPYSEQNSTNFTKDTGDTENTNGVECTVYYPLFQEPL